MTVLKDSLNTTIQKSCEIMVQFIVPRMCTGNHILKSLDGIDYKNPIYKCIYISNDFKTYMDWFNENANFFTFGSCHLLRC